MGASWCGPEYPNATVQWNTWETVEQCTSGNKKGCLFNIWDDPGEHHDLALDMPQVVDDMLARMHLAQKNVFDPDRGETEITQACAQLARNGGFWGPWRNEESVHRTNEL